MATRAEVLGFIAVHEPLGETRARFPDLSPEQLKSLLRQAAVLMASEDAELEPPAARTEEGPPVKRARAEAPERDGNGPAKGGEGEPVRALRGYSDGAARGNPGPAGAGAVVTKTDGTVVARLGKFLGEKTNNHAEYMGLLLGLEAALKLGANEVEVYADSELLVRQLQGAYRVKSAALRPLFEKAVGLLGRFRRTKVTHVYREQNQLADEMSNRAIDERM